MEDWVATVPSCTPTTCPQVLEWLWLDLTYTLCGADAGLFVAAYAIVVDEASQESVSSHMSLHDTFRCFKTLSNALGRFQ